MADTGDMWPPATEGHAGWATPGAGGGRKEPTLGLQRERGPTNSLGLNLQLPEL